MSEEEQEKLVRLTAKHQTQLFSLSLAHNQHLAEVTQASVGQSWTLLQQDYRTDEGPSLEFYLDLLNIFRSIRTNILTVGEALVMQDIS